MKLEQNSKSGKHNLQGTFLHTKRDKKTVKHIVLRPGEKNYDVIAPKILSPGSSIWKDWYKNRKHLQVQEMTQKNHKVTRGTQTYSKAMLKS